jgi:phage terminase large subunit-like protein
MADDTEVLERAQRERLLELLREQAKRDGQKLFHNIFPEVTVYEADGCTVAPIPGTDGIQMYARKLYPKHMEFFKAGKIYRERAAICANRIGKTLSMGAFETTCHLTGLYPKWWEGKKFTKPVRAWAVGETYESTRDTVQVALLGHVETIDAQKKGMTGTGMIPGKLITSYSWKQSVKDFVDVCKVKHVSGGFSTLGLKAYQQGVGSFAGTAQHVIWCDELCPEDVWMECLTRTATTGGIIYLTVTPLKGLTGAVRSFFENEKGK